MIIKSLNAFWKSQLIRNYSGFNAVRNTNCIVLLIGKNQLGKYNSAKYFNLFNSVSSKSISKMAKLIDGKAMSEEVLSELKIEIDQWVAQGNRQPQLTAVLIGSDEASKIYVNNKMKAAERVGINSITKNLPPEITEQDLLNEIEKLNNDNSVDGILVQLPLPEHINERNICNAVCWKKDVDGFNEVNVGRLSLGMNSFVPCTPLGIYEMLKRAGIETFGKNAVVANRSKNIGIPITMLLHSDGRHELQGLDATVTICHRFTPSEELIRFCKSADIIVSATGIQNFIKADMIKKGACVIDVGIIRIKDGETGKTKIVGDVDFENVKQVAGYISPVPGGVGPMTVAMLMRNTFVAAKNLAQKK